MNEFEFAIDNYRFRSAPLGEELQDELPRFYRTLMQGAVPDDQFEKAAMKYFDTHRDSGDHNRYFEAFTSLWNLLHEQGITQRAKDLWPLALDPVLKWQASRNARAHKGTPYYFLGGKLPIDR
ncbi:MAG: hypothetical protein ACE5HL_05145 [Terriglobia bacterium]